MWLAARNNSDAQAHLLITSRSLQTEVSQIRDGLASSLHRIALYSELCTTIASWRVLSTESPLNFLLIELRQGPSSPPLAASYVVPLASLRRTLSARCR